MHLAAKRNQTKLIPILLQYHAELDITDRDGRTALIMAASEGTYFHYFPDAIVVDIADGEFAHFEGE